MCKMDFSTITTPFGPINVFADDVALAYTAIVHTFDRPPVKEHPIAGCFRIRVPVGSHRSIRCEVGLENTSIPNTGGSGEDYADAEFIFDTTILTIGAEDENPAFDTIRTKHGMEYRIHGCASEVVFGIAWTTDYEGASDCRTWFAADPTL